jgi:AmiR/NasT family two-component response regulator
MLHAQLRLTMTHQRASDTEPDMTTTLLLIVAEDSILATNLARMAARQGCRVLDPVPSGEEALAQLHDHSVDVVLIDARLAGQPNGADTAGIINRTLQVPIVLLTDAPPDSPPT